jgi:hypothetical protein
MVQSMVALSSTVVNKHPSTADFSPTKHLTVNYRCVVDALYPSVRGDIRLCQWDRNPR